MAQKIDDIINGTTDNLKKSIKHDADLLIFKDNKSNTLLHLLIKAMPNRAAQIYVADRRHYRDRNQYKETPQKFHYQSWRNNQEWNTKKDAFNFLIERSDVNAINDGGNTPLHLATYSKQIEIVEALIAAGAAVNIANQHGLTPVDIAVKIGAKKIFGKLIGADSAQSLTPQQCTSLLMLANDKRELEMMAMLLYVSCTQQKVKINQLNRDGLTPLHVAVMNNNALGAQLLIEAGADLDIITREGYTALHWAIVRGNETIIKSLIEGRANLSIINSKGHDALGMAILDQQLPITKLLLAGRADANALTRCTNEGNSLHAALWAGFGYHHRPEFNRAECIDILIQHQVNLNQQDWEGWTPSHLAILVGHESMLVEHLLKYKPELNIQDNHGRTPFYYSIKRIMEKKLDADSVKIATMLIQAGADFYTQGESNGLLLAQDNLPPKIFNDLMSTYLSTLPQSGDLIILTDMKKELSSLLSVLLSSSNKLAIDTLAQLLAIFEDTAGIEGVVKHIHQHYADEVVVQLFSHYYDDARKYELNQSKLEQVVIHHDGLLARYNKNQEDNKKPPYIPLAAQYPSKSDFLDFVAQTHERYREEVTQLVIANSPHNPHLSLEAIFTQIPIGKIFSSETNEWLTVYSKDAYDYIAQNKERILSDANHFLWQKYEIDRTDLVALFFQHDFLQKIQLKVLSENGMVDQDLLTSLKNLQATFSQLEPNQQYDQIEKYTTSLNFFKAEMIAAAKLTLQQSADMKIKSAARRVLIDLSGTTKYVVNESEAVQMPYVLISCQQAEAIDNYLLATTTTLTPAPFYQTSHRLLTMGKLKAEFGAKKRAPSAQGSLSQRDSLLPLKKQSGKAAANFGITHESVWTLNAFLDVMISFLEKNEPELNKLLKGINEIVADLSWNFDLDATIPSDICQRIDAAIEPYKQGKAGRLSNSLQKLVNVLNELMHFQEQQNILPADNLSISRSYYAQASNSSPFLFKSNYNEGKNSESNDKIRFEANTP